MAFDVDSLIRHGGRLRCDDLELLTAFRDRPLDAEVLRCLRYMHDIESHTVCYLRDVLVTRAHRDPDITTFMTIWNYEEHFHGEALSQVLAAHGELSGRRRVATTRAARGRKDRWRPLAFMLGSAVMKDFTAIHMAWGAINEWTTQAGYSRLAAKAGHPVLTELLHRIMRQEGRHIDYYSTEARARLGCSRAARRVTRMALQKFWGPVGTGVQPEEEVGFVVDYLFGDPPGLSAAARIDRNIDRLPGLEGLGLVSGVVHRFAA
jgi:hypothetical protein